MLVEIFCFLELLHSQGGHPLKRKVTCVAASSWYLFLELSFKPVVFGTRACRRWGVFARALHAYSIGERPAVQRGSGVVGRRLDLADGLWSVEWGLSFKSLVGWRNKACGGNGGGRREQLVVPFGSDHCSFPPMAESPLLLVVRTQLKI